jgi:hypothetical protein
VITPPACPRRARTVLPGPTSPICSSCSASASSDLIWPRFPATPPSRPTFAFANAQEPSQSAILDRAARNGSDGHLPLADGPCRRRESPALSPSNVGGARLAHGVLANRSPIVRISEPRVSLHIQSGRSLRTRRLSARSSHVSSRLRTPRTSSDSSQRTCHRPVRLIYERSQRTLSPYTPLGQPASAACPPQPVLPARSAQPFQRHLCVRAMHPNYCRCSAFAALSLRRARRPRAQQRFLFVPRPFSFCSDFRTSPGTSVDGREQGTVASGSRMPLDCQYLKFGSPLCYHVPLLCRTAETPNSSAMRGDVIFGTFHDIPEPCGRGVG